MANIQVIFHDGSMQKTTDRVGSIAEQNYHTVGITSGSLMRAAKYYFESKKAYEYWCKNGREKTEKDGHFQVITGTYTSSGGVPSPQKTKKKEPVLVDESDDDEFDCVD